MEIYLAAVGLLALVIGLGSRVLHRLPVTEPLLGLVMGVILGPRVLDATELPARGAVLGSVAEISVAFAIMSIALRFRVDEIRRCAVGLALLLTVVLAAMTAISTVMAFAILGLPLSAAWLLGALIAPTDPVLASSVVTGDAAERDLPLRTRLLISIESGGNDALALAFFAVGVAAVAGDDLFVAAGVASLELVWGAVLGGAIGWIAGRALRWSKRHRDIEHAAFLTLTLALVAVVLGGVELAGGSGLLGVLAAGLTYGHQISQAERSEEWEVQEAINRYLVVPVFVLLGVVLPWSSWGELGWTGPAFVAAVLILRRLPVLMVLHRPVGVRRAEAAFLGWFGPIGAAALLYLTEAGRQGVLDEHLWAAGTMVIAVSTVVHGVIAAPGRRLFTGLLRA